MTYYRSISRSSLGEWIDGNEQGDTRSTKDLSELAAHHLGDKTDLILVWPEKPTSGLPPSLIVTANGGVTDFLAWAGSFLAQSRPITARCRVIEQSVLRQPLGPWKPEADRSFRHMGIGLILGELLSTDPSIRRGRREVIPAVNLLSGLSFVCLRELCIHTGASLEGLARRWTDLRKLTRQRERSLAPESILFASKIAGSIAGRFPIDALSQKEREVAEFCRARRAVEPHGRRFALTGVPELESLGFTADETREVRLKKVETAIGQILKRGVGDQELDAFAIGFMANAINPGALTFVDLIASLLDRWPSALLWYGLCAGLSPASNVANEASGIGARAWREVVRPDSLLAPPWADLSFEELDVFLSSDRPAEDYPLLSNAFACIELAPSIWTAMSWAGRRHTETSDAGTSSIREAWRIDVEREVGFLLGRAQDLLGHLSRGRPPANRQDVLDLEDRSKRGRHRR
ncbi:hypothetical protein [Myxococcus xanthus]|uniref:hypothetical protein n=1 Tax=Myxococcus xanthus TaxID=34 RepID=UPI001126DF35|nr:hypothetical protein [Myxococcus xanthus]